MGVEKVTGKMVLSGQGVQHCAKGFMTLRQRHEQNPWGTRQHPVICMPAASKML